MITQQTPQPVIKNVIDKQSITNSKLAINSGSIEEREQAILERIKKHYGVQDEEAKEISLNLLGFAKAIYGIE